MYFILKKTLKKIIKWLINISPENFLLRILKIFNYSVSTIANRSVYLHKNNPKQAKSMLEEMIELEKSTDHAINEIANHYYQGKHPKHYLWTTHNDFIVDNVKSGDKVIDIGCGASQYPIRLAEKGANVLCIDKNPQRIEDAKRLNVHPNLKYIVLDILNELPNEQFDVVVCSHIIEHLKNPVDFLKKLRQIARKLIIKVPRLDSGWKKLMKKDLGLFYYDDSDHFKEYNWQILKDELKKSGWTPLKMETGIDLRVMAE